MRNTMAHKAPPTSPCENTSTKTKAVVKKKKKSTEYHCSSVAAVTSKSPSEIPSASSADNSISSSSSERPQGGVPPMSSPSPTKSAKQLGVAAEDLPPSSASETTCNPASVTFASLGLCPELCSAVSTLNWKSPTAIQSEVLPYALSGRDVIALAETGSGKTAAFGLPILQRLLEHQGGSQRFYALVLAPTRELCLQISQQILAMGATLGVTVVTLVGGLDHNTQAVALAKRPHVIVGSPGRVVDHLQQTKGFSLKTVKVRARKNKNMSMSVAREELGRIHLLSPCIP